MPLSEGFRGLKPSRLHQRVKGMTAEDAVVFLLRLIEMLVVAVAVGLGSFALVIAVFIWLLNSIDDRRQVVNTKLNNVVCLALHYTPPDSSFHHDLAVQYPHCPKYTPPRLGSNSTRTKTVTRHPKAHSTTAAPPHGIKAPGPSTAPSVGPTPTPAPSPAAVATATSPPPAPRATTRTVSVPGRTTTKTVAPPSKPPPPASPPVLCVPLGVIRLGC